MHTSLATNSLSFFESVTSDQPHLIAAVYPSSPESGAAAIGTYGNLATLLDLDDVAALRDLLTTCLVQAGRESSHDAVVDREGLLWAWHDGAFRLWMPYADRRGGYWNSAFAFATREALIERFGQEA